MSCDNVPQPNATPNLVVMASNNPMLHNRLHNPPFDWWCGSSNCPRPIGLNCWAWSCPPFLLFAPPQPSKPWTPKSIALNRWARSGLAFPLFALLRPCTFLPSQANSETNYWLVLANVAPLGSSPNCRLISRLHATSMCLLGALIPPVARWWPIDEVAPGQCSSNGWCGWRLLCAQMVVTQMRLKDPMHYSMPKLK